MPLPVKYTLCVDGDEFREAMVRDILAATQKVYVQTLSFEGDSAGKSLADAISETKAPDRRIWADSVTEYLVNDRFLWNWGNRRDPVLQAEVAETKNMVTDLRQTGVQVILGDPIGLPVYRLLIRNHKKVILVDDDIVYIGGINFSEHNFAWHDFMLRIQSREVADFLKEDFLLTWDGKRECSSAVWDDIELYSVDGLGNHSIRAALARLIGEARHEIYVQCPYITSPFFELLGQASARGVDVTVVISEIHNRGLMKEGMVLACRRQNLKARFYQGRMTHAKAMMVDGSALVLGSANFDYSSFGMQPELLGIFRDPGLIAEFQRRIIDEDLKHTREATEEDLGGIRSHIGYHGIQFIGWLFRVTNKLP